MKSEKEISKRSMVDKIRSIAGTIAGAIAQPVVLSLVLFIIFKSLIEPDASQRSSMIFVAFFSLLVIEFLIIKINPELSLQIRESAKTIFSYIGYLLMITTCLCIFAIILQDIGICELFTTESLIAFVVIFFLFYLAFLAFYIIFDAMVTYFAEDAEYFFREGCDTLSKIEHKYKNSDDILIFLFFYINGFKKINGKLGKQLSLLNIKFKSEDIGVLDSIYKKLPYYLLYGKKEQFERTKCHIGAIRQSLRKSNGLNGVLIIDEIDNFLDEINKHIGKKEILPYKKSFLAEFIREHREWIIPSIVPVIVLIASYFVPGVLDTIKQSLGL